MPSITELAARGDYRVAVVLGSGLGRVAAALTGASPIPYSDVDGWPVPAVEGHEGALYTGEDVLALAGRVHLYEGHAPAVVTRAVRDVVAAGCTTVILTNAAGAIRRGLSVGDPVLISDHLNLTGSNPLVGTPSFLDLSEVYDPDLRELARSIEPGLPEGVYAGVTGPVYETPAEIRMLATLGADLVGMSTVHEAIAARSLGARVLGISVVTNPAAGPGVKLDHEDVKRAGAGAAERLEALLRGVVSRL